MKELTLVPYRIRKCQEKSKCQHLGFSSIISVPFSRLCVGVSSNISVPSSTVCVGVAVSRLFKPINQSSLFLSVACLPLLASTKLHVKRTPSSLGFYMQKIVPLSTTTSRSASPSLE